MKIKKTHLKLILHESMRTGVDHLNWLALSVGDLVDVDGEYNWYPKIRITKKVEDISQISGLPSGLGFVGEDEYGDDIVFSIDDVVPSSYEKYIMPEHASIVREEVSQMAVPEGGHSVIRAEYTRQLSDALKPLFDNPDVRSAVRDQMLPVLTSAAEHLGGPGETPFHEEARSLIYDAIKVHLQDIIDDVLNAPYQI